jgi:transcription antitermination factor NusG
VASDDRRDAESWVVLELTRQGEIRADEGTLAKAIADALDAPEHEVFVPAITYVKDGTKVTVHLMEGYVFVRSGLPESVYFTLPYKGQLVRKVLSNTSTRGMPYLQVVSDAHVDELKRQLSEIVASDITEGMSVKITQSHYGGLTGKVVWTDGDDAFIHIKLRSFEVIRTVPKVFLEPVGDDYVP